MAYSTTSAGFVSTSPSRPRPRPTVPLLPPAIFATLVFVITELMFFLALLSAYFVVKSRAFSTWLPPEDVRLPVAVTFVNTLILIGSGLSLIAAERLYRQQETRDRAFRLYTQAMVMGAVFVGVQGYEWIKLISLGFTIGAGLFSATFFLLIGSHGVHALGALIVMASFWPKIKNQTMTLDQLRAMGIFWFFVVAVWPVLFSTVYFY